MYRERSLTKDLLTKILVIWTVFGLIAACYWLGPWLVAGGWKLVACIITGLGFLFCGVLVLGVCAAADKGDGNGN